MNKSIEYKKTRNTIILIFGPAALIMIAMVAVVLWNISHSDQEIPDTVNASTVLQSK